MRVLQASIVFKQSDHLWWVGALVLLGVIAVLVTYARFPQRGPWKWAGAGLKILGLLLLLFCLLEPMLAQRKPKKDANIFLVLSDNSESLEIKDEGVSTGRGETMKADLLKAEEAGWLRELNDQFKVHRYSFGERLRRLTNFEALSFDERSSSLHAALREIGQRYAERPLAGIFVLTDGNVNDFDVDLSELPVDAPLYPVAAAGESSGRDTSIRQVTMNLSAFEDAPVTLNVEAALRNVSNEDVEVAVFSGDGKRLQAETVTTAETDGRETVSFQLKPDRAEAVAFYRVVVRQAKDAESLENADEATVENNAQYVVANLPQGPYNLLYIAGRPHWTYKFFKRAIAEDKEFQLASLIRVAKREPKFQYKGREGEDSNPLFRGFQGAQDAAEYDQPVIIAMRPHESFELGPEFPKLDENLFQFSAIILDKVEAEFFTFNQQERLQQFVSRRGGGLVMLGGQEGFHKGGYEKTPIGEMLPAYLERQSANQGIGSSAVELSREGWLQPWARLRRDQASEEERLAQLPQVMTVNTLGPLKPGASLISFFRDRSGTEHPILVTQSYGKGRTVALTVGDLWRWGFSNPDRPELMEDLNKFYRQLMRWMVTDVPQRVKVETRLDSGRFPPRAILAVTVNDEKFFPDSKAQVDLLVTDPAGETSELRASLSTKEPGTYEASYTAVAEGFYRVKAIVQNNEKQVIGEAVSGWAVNSARDEFQSLSGNRALLDSLAMASKGEVVPVSELSSFVSDLINKPLPVMETRTSPLWHLPVFFFLALLCFAGEWGIKRWKGLP